MSGAPLDAVRLTLPIFGGHLGFAVYAAVNSAAGISPREFGGTIPHGAKGKVNPAAIGAKSPPPMT